MIKVDCDQGSPEWFAAKVGVASASGFDRLVTASKKPSSQANDYLYELTAEWVTGEKKYIRPSYWMERGVEMEPEARESYEFMVDSEVEQIGFIYKDKSKLIGCSPDGLCGDMGLEIKCPSPINHVSYLLQGVCPKGYMAQVQGSMWVTGLKQWVFMSYHPEYEPFVITVDADPVFQKALDEIIPPFVDLLKEARESPKVIELRGDRLEKAA
ncbi:MAG: exonuclease [Gammaproteobacteria bacterium]|nr:MAG: exonuclease [Gammaproteobacteria bacterium]